MIFHCIFILQNTSSKQFGVCIITKLIQLSKNLDKFDNINNLEADKHTQCKALDDWSAKNHRNKVQQAGDDNMQQ